MRTILLFVIIMHPWCTGCFPCVWEVSLTDACSPWHVLVGALAGEGLCLHWVRVSACLLGQGFYLPIGPGSSACLLGLACPPSLACPPGEGLCLPVIYLCLSCPDTLFPFYCKGYISMCHMHQSLSLYYRVVSRWMLYVSHFARSVPRCISLLPGYAYTQVSPL